jgi:hypothetical protein
MYLSDFQQNLASSPACICQTHNSYTTNTLATKTTAFISSSTCFSATAALKITSQTFELHKGSIPPRQFPSAPTQVELSRMRICQCADYLHQPKKNLVVQAEASQCKEAPPNWTCPGLDTPFISAGTPAPPLLGSPQHMPTLKLSSSPAILLLSRKRSPHNVRIRTNCRPVASELQQGD